MVAVILLVYAIAIGPILLNVLCCLVCLFVVVVVLFQLSLQLLYLAGEKRDVGLTQIDLGPTYVGI